MTQNDTANVSVGKGVVGGYMFTAPVGTPLPTDHTSALDAAFVNVGFLSDEGITASVDASTDTFNDLNGDQVAVAVSSRERTLGVQFIEVNEVSLKENFGQDNVAVDASGNITVVHKNTDMEHRSLVMELVLRDGRPWRRVVPDAQVTEWDDTTIVSSELFMMPVTYSLAPDTTGAYVYDYIAPAVAEDTPSVTLNQHTANLAADGTRQLTATTVPADSEVAWTSSDEDIATVEDGLVTAVAAGTATITATITVGGVEHTDTCAVTVSE